MGTNFYVTKPACEQCGCKQSLLHIGKASAGWPFLFRVDDGLGVRDWPTWKRLLSRPGYGIQDEYGRDHTLEELEDRVVGARPYWDGPMMRQAKDVHLTLEGDAYTHGWFS